MDGWVGAWVVSQDGMSGSRTCCMNPGHESAHQNF